MMDEVEPEHTFDMFDEEDEEEENLDFANIGERDEEDDDEQDEPVEALMPGDEEPVTLTAAHEAAESLPTTTLSADDEALKHFMVFPVKDSDLAKLEKEAKNEEPGVIGQGFFTALQNIRKDRWNAEAWTELYSEAKGAKFRRREVLRAMVGQFPTSGAFWSKLIDFELTRAKPDVEAIDRDVKQAMALTGHANLELWYLDLNRVLEKYEDALKVMREHAGVDRQVETSVDEEERKVRATVVEKYEECLRHVGADFEAGKLWTMYADFVRDWPTGNAADVAEKTSKLRDILKRAVSLPLKIVDSLWKRYEEVDRQAGPELSQGPDKTQMLLAKYKAALEASKARKLTWDTVQDRRPACPPHCPMTTEDGKQLRLWRARLQSEAANHEKLNADELRRRVVHSFEQCVACMRFYPELWFDYANYELSKGLAESSNAAYRRAESVYQRAILTLPDSTLLHLGLAELLEARNQDQDMERARSLYTSLIRKVPTSDMAWALYQRFVRRVDGIEAAREVFRMTRKARLAGELTHFLYISHALLEWRVNHASDVALRVLRYAMLRHPHFLLSKDFIICLTDLLTHHNEVNDARSVFERALKAVESCPSTEKPSPANQKQMWLAYMRFEVLHAANSKDGGRVRKLEERMLAALGAKTELNSMERSQEAQQRLWWRHAPPGMVPGACATLTDFGMYNRWTVSSSLPITIASEGSTLLALLQAPAEGPEADKTGLILPDGVAVSELLDHLPLVSHQWMLSAQTADTVIAPHLTSQGRAEDGSAAATAAGSSLSSVDLQAFPPFLHRLVMMLPPACKGQSPDVDFVLKMLLTGQMPQETEMRSQSLAPEKRRADDGTNEEDRTSHADDIFRKRQKLRI